MRATFRVSERFGFRVVGQHRSTSGMPSMLSILRRPSCGAGPREVAADHIRLDRRMAYRMLSREGLRVNHKRVHRL